MPASLKPLPIALLLSLPFAPMHAVADVPGPSATSAAQPGVPAEAEDFVAYWLAGGMPLWFGKDPALDRRLRERYEALYARAARGELAWGDTALGALAQVLLLDQFPRNAYRDSARMYATDELARHAARQAIARGYNHQVPEELRRFFVLPFAHSESLADQSFAVELARELTQHDLERAQHHRAIVERFGRFPHRNALLGRPSSAAEERYLAEGGFRG